MTEKERLLKGAAKLGELWRGGVRCQGGWDLECPCDPKNTFCKAKALWFELAVVDGRVFPDSKIAFIEAMTTEEREATGLTVTIEAEGVGQLTVGAKGQISWKAWSQNDAEAIKSVLRVLKTFKGSKII